MSLTCMRELAPNIRFLLWISNAKRVLLRPFAKSRDAQSMCQRYPYIFLTCLLLSLLTLLVSIILPSYKRKPRDLITLLFRVSFTSPPPLLNPAYVIER